MVSYLLFVVSLVSSGFGNKNLTTRSETQVLDGGGTTGGLIVTMGPVMNLRVADVRVIPGHPGDELPAVAPKGSLFEGFSHSRLYAIRCGK